MGRKQRNLTFAPCWVLMLALPALFSAWGCAKKATTDHVYIHEVEAGETLDGIADAYYGDPTRADAIAEFNGIQGDWLEAGTSLRIPMSEKDLANHRTREKALVPYNHGIALAQSGAYVDAVARFQEAIELDPRFPDAHYNLGVTLQKLGAYDKAMKQFRDVCRLRPEEPEYHFALGNAYFHLEGYDRAAESFERVLELDPGHAKALYSLAVSFEKLGDTDNARRTWERYLEVDPGGAWADEARRRLKDLE